MADTTTEPVPPLADHTAVPVAPVQPDPPPLARLLRVGRVAPGSEEAERLRQIWEARPGWRGWFSTVDHKTIGLRYLVTAFIFLLAGGVEALIMRIQLARPNATLLTPEQYNQLFTMHGVTMIFLYALPVLSGFSNYLWPLILGAPECGVVLGVRVRRVVPLCQFPAW
jgi:cytochrome c oxidase subunit I+III